MKSGSDARRGGGGSRFPLLTAQAVIALSVLGAPSVKAATECDAFAWQEERLDYNSGRDKLRISQVEQHHFDANTENLVRGMTSTVGGDIDFLLRYSPNHHRGLAALVRLAIKDKTPQPSGVQITVECYLQRALEFAPSDAEVMKIYGAYLSRLGRSGEALAQYEQAEKLVPDDPVIAYNIGLLLVEKRDFDGARTYAKKAYAGGIQFPGLREKLAKQGQWR